MRRDELFELSPEPGRRAAILAKRLRERENHSGCPDPYHCPPDCPVLKSGNCPDSD